MTYFGIFAHDASITQGLHQGAVDVAMSPNWYDLIYAPYQSGVQELIPWRFIRTNSIDTAAANVKYSAIQRADGQDDITFAFFHTDECTNKVGDIIHSGDFVCKTAPNGKFTGPHCHVSPRRNGMKKLINPYSVLDWYAGGVKGLGVIKGKDNFAPTQPPITVDYQAKYDALHAALVQFSAVQAQNDATERDMLAKLLTI